ncbi:NAD-dependent epimerase/dehydratase family protein [Planctomycetota bacterium]
MTRKMLICGATGFIGRNLLEYFGRQANYEVYGTYHDSPPVAFHGVRLVRADLTRREDVERVVRGMDIVVQAAATSSGVKDVIQNPSHHVTDNAVMNALIFRACYDYRVSQVVYFSCTAMYPYSEQPLRETDFDAKQELDPIVFGKAWTKVYNEKMCEYFAQQGSACWTVIRHSHVYGPYDKVDLEQTQNMSSMLAMVLAAPSGGAIEIRGDNSHGHDLLYVGDLVDFVERALDRQQAQYELFNVGGGYMICAEDLVKKIVRASGGDLVIRFNTNQTAVNMSPCLDCNKARELLGWTPETSLDEGLQETISWVLTQQTLTVT